MDTIIVNIISSRSNRHLSQELLHHCSVSTGSGKTWMQGLIAKYHCEQGKRATVVEPNELLRVQTAEKLGFVHFSTLSYNY